jgi:2-dehydro-3-deoxygalactonokinase
MTPAFIGIDWGTTHRRASVLDAQGRVLARHADSEGMLACAGRFRQSLDDLLLRWPQARADVPVVMSGMVGAASGWQEAPYLDAATPIADLAQHLVPLHDAPPGRQWQLVPGYRWRGEGDRVDVMRGEETQLLGALHQLGPAGAHGCYLLPGTHSKWVRLRAGRVVFLRTYMSGELFALLRERGTLAAALQATPAEVDPQAPSFARGVSEAAELALSHALFGVRARVVTGALATETAAAHVSGLLIGTEWHDLARASPFADVVRIIGAPALSGLHARCAELLGHRVEVMDALAVQLAAWQALQACMTAMRHDTGPRPRGTMG